MDSYCGRKTFATAASSERPASTASRTASYVAARSARKAADKKEIAEKDDAGVRQIDDEVAVTMRGAPIFAPQFVVRNIEHEFIGETFGRRADNHRVIAGTADTPHEPFESGLIGGEKLF